MGRVYSFGSHVESADPLKINNWYAGADGKRIPCSAESTEHMWNVAFWQGELDMESGEGGSIVTIKGGVEVEPSKLKQLKIK